VAVELFGIVTVTCMVTTYAFEDRSHLFVLGFAVSCAAASAYAVMIRSWPFAVVEGLWSIIALRRWLRGRRSTS
jgi:hypothetical protein